ncbi:MAG TPA: trigger factor [Terriglobales bacterium]|nr:trigger factor [Terriglobales bacterium]
MNSTETKDSCVREIQVEIPAEVVATQTETVVRKYTKLARVPGFRRGKVPATVIRQRFADDVKGEVVEALVPEYFQKETEKQKLHPVSQPRVTDLHLHDGEPLRFKATFEVLPEIEVPGYKDIRPELKDTSVNDEEVDAALKNLQEQHASYSAVTEERPLADGDFAQVSFEGVPKVEAPAEGEEAKPAEAPKPVKVDEVLVEIGGSNTVKEFSENLREAKSGETKTFDVSYPADFSDQRLAGKTMTYTVTVNGIKTKQVPELSDEFAKQVGEFETLDALKQRIRDGIKGEKEHEAEHEAKDKIVDELVSKAEFPVPDALVDRQIDLRLERGLRALAAQGMRAEDLKRMDFNRLRAGQRDQAVREVKASLILDKIAELENIEVGDEEVNKEIEAIAAQSRQSVDEVRARLTQDGAINRIRDRIRNEKALDFLYRRPA